MLYPLSYEGITGLSCLSPRTCHLHSTTPAEEVAKSSPLITITLPYSSMRGVGDE